MIFLSMKFQQKKKKKREKKEEEKTVEYNDVNNFRIATS